MTRLTKPGRKWTAEQRARVKRAALPVTPLQPATTLPDHTELLEHDHVDDRFYGDCPACDPEGNR